jgi:hypothetical protein
MSSRGDRQGPAAKHQSSPQSLCNNLGKKTEVPFALRSGALYQGPTFSRAEKNLMRLGFSPCYSTSTENASEAIHAGAKPISLLGPNSPTKVGP